MQHHEGSVLQNVLPCELLVPAWAVPARGESKLEPVCESIGRQGSVDLTSKKAFRVGRSPSCDVQLMHATSSRRHAMLFHHSNGSCYVVECGSAHGTFVNGKRISSPALSGNCFPHKVRRCSLVRFGGPGAPCFVLKSFSTHMLDIKSGSEAGLAVRRNTRLNALGKTGFVHNDSVCDLTVDRKRSFDSLSSDGSLMIELPDCKRSRCSSPPLSPEAPLRLVSPDPPSMTKQRRVTFSLPTNSS